MRVLAVLINAIKNDQSWVVKKTALALLCQNMFLPFELLLLFYLGSADSLPRFLNFKTSKQSTLNYWRETLPETCMFCVPLSLQECFPNAYFLETFQFKKAEGNLSHAKAKLHVENCYFFCEAQNRNSIRQQKCCRARN